MASGIYNRWKANLMNKEVDMEADTIKVMLLDTNHSFTAGDNTKSQIVSNEVSGTGYSAGGNALASKAVTQAATTKFDAADTVFSTVTITTFHAVLYDDTLSGDDLIASIDFGGEQQITAANFTIVWNASGIITLA